MYLRRCKPARRTRLVCGRRAAFCAHERVNHADVLSAPRAWTAGVPAGALPANDAAVVKRIAGGDAGGPRVSVATASAALDGYPVADQAVEHAERHFAVQENGIVEAAQIEGGAEFVAGVLAQA